MPLQQIVLDAEMVAYSEQRQLMVRYPLLYIMRGVLANTWARTEGPRAGSQDKEPH